MRDFWWVSVGVFLTAPWVWWQARRFTNVALRAHVAREAIDQRKYRMFVAMGGFEISVGLTLFTFGGQGSWSNGVSVFLLGVGFVVYGLWHPLDRLLASDD